MNGFGVARERAIIRAGHTSPRHNIRSVTYPRDGKNRESAAYCCPSQSKSASIVFVSANVQALRVLDWVLEFMVAPRKSHSSDASASLAQRVTYLRQLVTMNANRKGVQARDVSEQLRTLARRYEAIANKKANASKMLEIGFGARPFRAFAAQLHFGDVTAVDLDVPVFKLADVPTAILRNGWVRGVKAAVRATVFDGDQWPSFHSGLKELDPNYAPEKSCLIVADAASDELWERIRSPLDFVVSHDVFEHIPAASLELMMKRIHDNLAPGGLVMTFPNLFTGITGGHDPHWYAHRVETNSSEGAWRHLWDDTFSVDTYVNRLSRRDMRSIFLNTGFRILSDFAPLGRLGEQHLTPEIEARLRPRYDDYELFSNRVEFILVRNKDFATFEQKETDQGIQLVDEYPG